MHSIFVTDLVDVVSFFISISMLCSFQKRTESFKSILSLWIPEAKNNAHQVSQDERQLTGKHVLSGKLRIGLKDLWQAVNIVG